MEEGPLYRSACKAAEAVTLQALRKAGMSDAEAVVSRAFAEASGHAPAVLDTAAAAAKPTGPHEYIGGRSPPARREVPHEDVHIPAPAGIHSQHHFHMQPLPQKKQKF